MITPEIWFLTGSQHLYGPETLKQVAVNSLAIAGGLGEKLPLKVVFKPVLTTPDAIRTTILEANACPECAGLILWMHTFSPAKMWIGGLSSLRKPFLHLHTQFNRDLPWAEIDMDSGVWTVPAERMKAGKVHRVPLSAPALALLQEVRPSGDVEPSAHVFPGEKAGRPLSNMAFLMRLRRMGRPDLTAHGFRSTFRDWAAETTHHPHEVVEMALAHAVGSKVEAAYRRGDLFEKRRALMDDWATYSMSKVTPPGQAPA